MKPAIPHDHNDLTPSWLSAVLGYQVISCDIGFLEGGVLSDAYKVRSISYQNAPADAPTALVIKIANKIKGLRDFGMMAHAYNKELNFFRDLSADVPITVPRLYGCDTDGSDGAEYFYIVMEDLSTHSRVFDQVNDPPDAAFDGALVARAAHGTGVIPTQLFNRPVRVCVYLENLSSRLPFPVNNTVKNSSC